MCAGIPRQNYGLAAPDEHGADAAYPPFAPAASGAYPSLTFPAAAPPPAPGLAYPVPSPPQPLSPAPQSPTHYSAPPSAQAAAAPAFAPPAYSAPAYSAPGPGPAAAAAAGPVSHAQKEAAKKGAKQAISALNFDDIESAVEALRGALRSLGVQ